MTQDEIIEMARQASDATKDARGRESFCFDSYGLEAFAKLVARYEREECAKRLDAVGCDHCAKNIRLRNKE
jgi:hypothetical protein